MSSNPLIDDCNRLIDQCKTLMLATTRGDDSHCSYVPFIRKDQNMYILVSALAEHTENLLNSENRRIGCMLVEDEATASQLFARRRIMFKSNVAQISRDTVKWNTLIGTFRQRFGDIIDLLESLPDFTIFELSPEQVVLVKGFGDAHQIDQGLFG